MHQLSTWKLWFQSITLLATPFVNAKILWERCPPSLDLQNASPSYDCANLTVPLDYSKKVTNGTLTIRLLRLPAVIQPSKGSVFVNYGGPGQSGLTSLVSDGIRPHIVIGGNYDIITVQPRGTGTTIPMTCGNRSEEIAWTAVNDEPSTNVATNWASADVVSGLCYKAQNETGSLIGTVAAARDIMAAVDALEEDGKLRYRGISYGTMLGSTLAALFPDRIERMMLDAVVNARTYHMAFTPDQLVDSDKVFSGFFEYCVKAGPTVCDLSDGKTTAVELEQRVWKFFEMLQDCPSSIASTVKLTWPGLQSLVVEQLYQPVKWPYLARALALLLKGDNGPETFRSLLALGAQQNLTDVLTGWYDPIGAGSGPLYGIDCSDCVDRAVSLNEILPRLYVQRNTSRIMAGYWDTKGIVCSRWRFNATERYNGSFDVKTAFPILLVSNSLDIVAPLSSAVNMSDTIPGSSLLVSDGYGHAMTGNPSICATQYARAYFMNGTLPANGTVCTMEAMPFTNFTWSNVFNPNSFGNSCSSVVAAEQSWSQNGGISYPPGIAPSGKYFSKRRFRLTQTFSFDLFMPYARTDIPLIKPYWIVPSHLNSLQKRDFTPKKERVMSWLVS